MKTIVSADDVVVVFAQKKFVHGGNKFIQNGRIRFSGRVEEGARSILVVAEGEKTVLVYSDKSVQHHKKQLESEFSITL